MELHVHTKFSKDSLLSFWGLYMKCVMLNIKWIAITDHNNVEGGIAFKKYCQRRGNRVNVIVGEEIYTDAGEIIGLFLKENVQPHMSVEDTIKEIKRQNGVVYVPHPFDEKRKKTVLKYEEIEKFKEKIDCIEVHNGRNALREYSIKQEEIANRNGIVSIVGSDAHTWMEIGRNYLIIENEPNDAENFMNAIQRSILVRKDCMLFSHQITKIVKGLRLIGAGKYNELYRIIIRKSKRSKH